MNGSLGTWLRLFGLLALEGAVVFGIAAQMQRWTQSAAWRRVIWQGCVASLLLLAVFELSGAARDWSGWLKEVVRPAHTARISGGHATQSAPKTESHLASQTIREAQKGPGGRMPPSTAGGTPAATMVVTPDARGVGAAGVDATAVHATRKNFDWMWAAVPGLVWLLGGAVVLGRMLVARIAFEIFRWRRREVKDGELRETVRRLALRLGIRRRVRLLESDEICGPVAFGILRPTIGLPTGFEKKFSTEQREAMLAHELAHLAGHDARWYLLADVLTLLLWWHPLAWRARWQLHAASELAADEASLLVANGPGVLAECLVEMGTRLTQRHALRQMGVAGNGFRSCLGRRVERLVKLEGNSWRPPNRIGGGLAWVLGTVFLVGAIIFCSAWVIPQAANKGEKGDNMKTMTEMWRQPLAAIALLASLNSSAVASPPAATAADAAPTLAATSANPATSTASATSAESNEIASRKTGNHATSSASSSLLPANNFAQAGSGQARTAGQGSVEAKLSTITIDSVQYDDLPLVEVINNLVEIAASQDPEKKGINFVLDREKPNVAAVGAIDPTTGLPIAMPEPIDLNNITVKIKPPLRHVRLIDVLEVMIKCADQPIKYSIEDYGVVISQDMSKASTAPPTVPGIAPPEPLSVMTFKVDTNTFFAGMDRTFGITLEHQFGGSVKPDAAQAALKQLAGRLGIDVTTSSLFYNDVTGMVMMRGSRQDINLMTAAIETLGGTATKSISSRP